MPLDTRNLRNCVGRFATGVTVVTYHHDGERHGATVNSFTSVSLDPPLVLVSLARSARAGQLLAGAPFAVNVLAANQLDIALHFAGRPRPELQVPWVDTADVPRLRGSVAWVQCRPWREYDGGDHVLYVGEVAHYDSRAGEPLLFAGGNFRRPGLTLYDLPRMVQLDGRPIPDWVDQLHRLHELSEFGHDL